MRKQFAAVLATAVLALAGCSGSKPAAEPTPAPSEVTAPPVSPSPSGDATKGVSLEKCMSGTYHLARFVSLGDNQTYGTGEGGDVTIAIDKGSYVMTGAGKKPIQLTLAAQQAQLGVDGTVKGSLTTDGFKGSFRVDSSTGSATLRSGVQQQELTMAQVASVLAPNGDAVLNCSTDKLEMVFDSIRLDLER